MEGGGGWNWPHSPIAEKTTFKKPGLIRVKEPTWITCSTSRLPDHILTNSSEKLSQKGVIDVGISDHQLIYGTKKIKRIKYNMHNQTQVRSLEKYSAEIFTNALKTV